MNAPERDPRIDPQVGDMISRIMRNGRPKVRRVIAVDRYDITYSDGGDSKQCFISTWQDWARKAEVLEQSPTPETASVPPRSGSGG